MMENGVKIPCRDGVIIGKWVEVGSGTTILPGTILSGKTTIGKECIIGPNSQIIDSAVGDSAVVNQSYCKKVNIKSGEEIGPFASLKS
jgi:bifunctional UDP-N-acetylglucosamine pyrophosphorylase/glucosamine-1-phosphate N-acetyltransferase